MTDDRSHVVVVIAAVVALLLQIVVAPNIAIAYAMPNFVAAYVLVVAVARPGKAPIVLAFVLGLAYNLFAGGPVGAMAFLLVLASAVASRAFQVLANDTLFMPLATLVVASVVVEFLYGGLVVVTGSADVSLFDALFARALPCALYDCVAALIFYPIVIRFVVRPDAPRTPLETTNLR